MTREELVNSLAIEVLNPEGDEVKGGVLSRVLRRYSDRGERAGKGIDYLGFGLREYVRLVGRPSRYTLAAWLYHAWEAGDEGMSSVAFLRDCRSLGFSLEEAERHVVPLISGCWNLTHGSSIVIDMELSPYGRQRVAYLRSARRTRDRWRHLGSRAWEEGRALGLVMLVQKDPMFQSPEFEEALAKTARDNIDAELGLLGYVPPPSSTETTVPTVPGQPMEPSKEAGKTRGKTDFQAFP